MSQFLQVGDYVIVTAKCTNRALIGRVAVVTALPITGDIGVRLSPGGNTRSGDKSEWMLMPQSVRHLSAIERLARLDQEETT
jgi:hypothetical protein